MTRMKLEFTVSPELTDALKAEIVACWTDVSNADGAVGFVPPVTAAEVGPAAEDAFVGVASGLDQLIIGRIPEGGAGEIAGEAGTTGSAGRLAAVAILVDGRFALAKHWQTVKRVMVHPDFQGRGYGTELMAEAARVGQAVGLEMLCLECRGGTGSELFYKKLGYVEFGRLPWALRVGEDDYRDLVHLYLAL
jgi:GNAT superfamily N-acetyltransferase